MLEKETLYLAGPMRGYPDLNRAAFLKYENKLKGRGFEVINPATLEGELPQEDTPSNFAYYMSRDIGILVNGQADGIALIPGWETSAGATLEANVAAALGLKIINAETLESIHIHHMSSSCILAEAQRIVDGVKQLDYGTPENNFANIGVKWGVTLKILTDSSLWRIGDPIPPAIVALMLIDLKTARQAHFSKRDNWIDIAGYAYAGSKIEEQ